MLLTYIESIDPKHLHYSISDNEIQSIVERVQIHHEPLDPYYHLVVEKKSTESVDDG